MSGCPQFLSAAALKAVLREHGLRLNKRLGQHYLVDRRIIERVVEACDISHEDSVIDVGAGLGALTEPLAQQAGRVVAVEIDARICALLKDRMASWNHVTVRCADILDGSWAATADHLVVVGAIPYQITSPIIALLTEQRRLIRRAILVIQHEVAQRLVAAPGTKAYGRISVLAQYAWELRLLFRVPRSAFFPQPEVDSACVRLSGRAHPAVDVADEAQFFNVVKTSFAHRRKTLVNCLSQSGTLGLSRVQAEVLVRALGLSPAVRGETLSLQQFAQLANLMLD